MKAEAGSGGWWTRQSPAGLVGTYWASASLSATRGMEVGGWEGR